MSVWIDLGLTLVIAGISFVVKRYRAKFSQIFNLVNKVEKALQDGVLTEEELQEIIQEIKKLANGKW